MIFSKLLKPKWQHRSADVRQLEIKNINEPDILNELARNDEAPVVRRTAVLKVTDLSILAHITQQDSEKTVRETAEERIKQLLCCQKNDCPAFDSRLTWFNGCNQTEIIAHVAQYAPETALRIAAINKLQREGLLGDIAIKDSEIEVRLAAIEKLSQKSTLERVFKATRNNDKRISRLAREKLDEILEEEERPAKVRAECETLCAKLESLERRLTSNVQGQNSVKSLNSETAELKRLQERWQAISAHAESPCQTRFLKVQEAVIAALENFQQALEEAQERETVLAPLRAAKQELYQQMEGFLIDLKKRQRFGREEQEAFDQRLETVKNEWAEVQVIDDQKEEQNWQKRFERIHQSLQKRYKSLQESEEIASRLEGLCTEAETKLNDKVALTTEDLKQLQARWKEVPQPTKPMTLMSELTDRFEKTLATLKTRLEEQTKQRSQAVQEVKQLLTQIETALEEGELKTAIPLEKNARHLLTKLVGLSKERKKSLEKRLQDSRDKIQKWREWQGWGNKLEREKLCEYMEGLLETESDNPTELVRLTEEAQTSWKRLGASGYVPEFWERFNKACQNAYQRYREYLCEQIEALLEGEHDPEESAKTIRKAQATWKNLGSQGHSQPLWDRFNKACQKAYEPCRTHFHIKSRERERNYSEKQALCDRLEQFAQETNWEHTNWKEVYHFVREMDKTWRNIGTTDRKLKKGVQRRFQSAMQVLEIHLNEERQRNCRSRVKLLGEVDELAQRMKVFMEKHQENLKEGDTQTRERVEKKTTEAINEVKKLQEQWVVTIPGNRRIEREFWQTFRSACDEVFNYRKQQQEAIKKEIQSYLESKIDLCKQVEALASLEGQAIKTAPAQVKKLKKAWKLIQLDGNKTQAGSLRKKAKATEAVEDRFEKACQQVDRAYQFQLLAERREQLDQLKHKSAFCVELEQADTLAQEEAQADPEWLNTVKTAWAALPELNDTKIETAITQRFEQAHLALSLGKPIVNDEALNKKETLCIRLEILLGIESPPDAAQARLAYQVSRLSAAMSGAEIKQMDKESEIEEIEREWYLIAAPSDQTARLEQRFHNACQRFSN
jgi:DNA repair protein SbcC/Rad50